MICTLQVSLQIFCDLWAFRSSSCLCTLKSAPHDAATTILHYRDCIIQMVSRVKAFSFCLIRPENTFPCNIREKLRASCRTVCLLPEWFLSNHSTIKAWLMLTYHPPSRFSYPCRGFVQAWVLRHFPDWGLSYPISLGGFPLVTNFFNFTVTDWLCSWGLTIILLFRSRASSLHLNACFCPDVQDELWDRALYTVCHSKLCPTCTIGFTERSTKKKWRPHSIKSLYVLYYTNFLTRGFNHFNQN